MTGNGFVDLFFPSCEEGDDLRPGLHLDVSRLRRTWLLGCSWFSFPKHCVLFLMWGVQSVFPETGVFSVFSFVGIFVVLLSAHLPFLDQSLLVEGDALRIL